MRNFFQLRTSNSELRTKTTLLLAAALLPACTVATPLPLTPIQVIEGTWPRPAVQVASTEKPFVIKGDTFTIPSLGLSVTRTSMADWAFQNRPNAAVVLFRGESEEPKPSLLIQLLALPAGTDVPAVVADEKNQLIAAGAKVAESVRTVSNVQGVQWIIDQVDPASKIEITTLRMYLLLPDGRLAAIQAQASKNNFTALKPQLDTMIDSVVLPGTDVATEDATATGS